MPKCPGQHPKRRSGKPHKGRKSANNPNDYKRPYKGHSWKGHGKDRRCELCGCKPT